ncbi:hypothetical protein FHS16_003772 [Paenibacillus endophyticus]|uniref:Uncharacterized protein n=1 Tax=Paenibacillus endophyticus TaxID=1294268 RepID=A0A7W5C9W9_9BACL|nr:hypothetical protein [Paenibacillus endophyticus]
MLNTIICLLSICYGIQQFSSFRKQNEKRDAIVILLFCGMIAIYCNPFYSASLPTVESFYTFVYKPISNNLIRK